MKSDLDFDATQEEKTILHKIISDAFLKKHSENLALTDILQSYDNFLSIRRIISTFKSHIMIII